MMKKVWGEDTKLHLNNRRIMIVFKESGASLFIYFIVIEMINALTLRCGFITIIMFVWKLFCDCWWDVEGDLNICLLMRLGNEKNSVTSPVKPNPPPTKVVWF